MRNLLMIAGLVMAAVAAAFVFSRPTPAPYSTETRATERLPVEEAERPRDTASAEPAADPEPPSPSHRKRVVAPEIIPGPAYEATELERLPPRPPLSETRRDENAGAPKEQLLHRPVAIAAGVIEAQGHRIRLEGIVPVNDDSLCKTGSGRELPCGRLALTAFRGWLRGRALTCDVPEKPGPETILARCSLAGKDAGRWLIDNGWATPEPDGVYAEAAGRR